MSDAPGPAPSDVTLFLCGDVMTGRGVDQILAHPSRPHIFEPYMASALGYVELAEAHSGPITRPVETTYVWGDALAELDRRAPQARIVNLETTVTTSEDAWPHKGINYRMHPANVGCLQAARIDCCVLANNHVLDWGYAGLAQTMSTLRRAGMRTAGAGDDETEAAAPAVLELTGGGRLLIFAFACESAGVPAEWAAGERRAGVHFLADLSSSTALRIATLVAAVKRIGDIAMASIHWGANWGYSIPAVHRSFAHRLIDSAGIDLIHGHSSHHPLAFEIYRERLILYGCGDFLNDYEGIAGHEGFRSDLSLMYFPALDGATGKLSSLELVPMQIRHLRLTRARAEDARWLESTLNREGRGYGTGVDRRSDDVLVLSTR